MIVLVVDVGSIFRINRAEKRHRAVVVIRGLKLAYLNITGRIKWFIEIVVLAPSTLLPPS